MKSMTEEPSQSLESLRLRLRQFADERDWEQFHSPKNLAMALIVEAAELVEHFQWLTEEQSRALAAKSVEDAKTTHKHQQIRHEMADILVYLVRLADQLDIDLLAAVTEKVQLNAEKYPATQVRGRADKYTEYQGPSRDRQE